MCRLAPSSFEECLVERGNEPILAWNSSLNHKCCFLMSPPLDWMRLQLLQWFRSSKGMFYKVLCFYGNTTVVSCDMISSSLSRVNNRIVIMSIHQPRYSIYKLFDTLTLLSVGSMVYHGNAHKALEYFEKSGESDTLCNVWI